MTVTAVPDAEPDAGRRSGDHHEHDHECALDAGIARLAPVSLAEIEAIAQLHTRIDRKYVVTPEVAAAVLAQLDTRCGALDIGGVRTFRYRSQYFDTADLASYRGAATGRRRRFKVRTRTYQDGESCTVEVKTRGGRGETVKVRLPCDAAAVERLDPGCWTFVDDAISSGPVARLLEPVLVTTYRRSTFLDPADGSRVTLDQRLVCTGRSGTHHALAGHVVLETKSTGVANAVDRLLWARGHRPARISKFGVGMALDDPSLPANRWNRVLRGAFGWTPQRTASHPTAA
jgi:hypothetical protein